MTIHYKTQGFIFDKSDMDESDSNFSVFTKDFGRLELRAKAIRKITSKLMPDIKLFYLSDLEFIQGKVAKTLTDATAIEKFENIFQDLEKFRIANRIREVLDNFIKGQEKDEAIFNLINDTFIKLNYKLQTTNYKLIYHYFLWNFLFLLGYKPEVDGCAHCHGKLNPYNIYFSNKSGGVICRKCLDQDANATKINSDIVKILRMIFKRNWQILSKLKIELASQRLFQTISGNYCSYVMPGNLFEKQIK